MMAIAQAQQQGMALRKNGLKKVEALPAKYADDVDLQLMARVKAGDDEAFNFLMQRNEKTVINLVYRFTGNREIASDLAQDVFLRIYRAAGRFEPRAKFFTFLYRVTLNVCRNYAAKTKRRQTTSLNSARKGQDGLSKSSVGKATKKDQTFVSAADIFNALPRGRETLTLPMPRDIL